MFNSNASAVSGDVNYIEDVFSTYIYTGTGSPTGLTVNNGIDLATDGGLLWCKNRTTAATEHFLFDTARNFSYTNARSLNTASSAAQASQGTNFAKPETTGFSFGDGAGSTSPNKSGDAFASWTFRKQPKFFDVVTYTGNGTTQSIAHNLGSTPGFVIIKSSTQASDWRCFHRSTPTGYIYLNSSDPLETINAALVYGNNVTTVAPTSTTITVGSSGAVNGIGETFVAYIYAHDAGGFGLTGTDNVISCGTATWNGSGVSSVTLGYEPQWVMIKSATSAHGWWIVDNMRGMPVDSNGAQLNANQDIAENASSSLVPRPTATGFTTGNGVASQTYIYIAIRRGPMKVPTSGTTVFEPVVRTGTGSVTSYAGLSFPPDMLMARKPSPAATYNFIVDRLRGYQSSLTTQEIDAEQPTNTLLTAFGMRGVTYDGTASGINQSGVTYVNHFFGRAPSYFDEVCYTGTGDVRTVTHNLGAVPQLMIVKARANARVWTVYSSATGNAGHLIFNNTSAYEANSADWNSTSPTASVFTVGGNYTVNDLNAGMVAYLFATCPGVSKVGSYTGTGTTQTINCGFTAGSRFVMIKRTDNAGDWYYWDSARGIVPSSDPYLLINSTAAEVTGTDYVDTTAVGFDITSTAPAALNASGGTYLFLAIA
jgi:hypothetical protein